MSEINCLKDIAAINIRALDIAVKEKTEALFRAEKAEARVAKLESRLEAAEQVVSACLSAQESRWDVEIKALQYSARFGGHE